MILISSFTFGQNRKLTDEQLNNSTAVRINLANQNTCEEIDGWIESDFANGIVFLFLQGGVAPISYKSDKSFERKYGIYFYDFGCIMASEKCTIKYNSKVFDYLTEKNGRKWLKKIRKDVIGLKEWKRASREK